MDLVNLAAQFNKVVVCSGQMIDQPNQSPHFPPEKENIVREHIAQQLLPVIAKENQNVCSRNSQ